MSFYNLIELLYLKYLLIGTISFGISLITLFSGFGLGTVLMPVLALFFPLPIAIAATALVHFANNIFKACLVGKYAKKSVVLRFGIPAAMTSALGASLFASSSFHLLVGGMVLVSSLFELIPKLQSLSFKPHYIPLGGLLSGFFGGVSGNQGVLRSAFLIKSGLSKEEFIGTGVMCSIIVDVVRLTMYGWQVAIPHELIGIVVISILSSFAGSYLGSCLMHKVTFKSVQMTVGLLLMVLGIGIMSGRV